MWGGCGIGLRYRRHGLTGVKASVERDNMSIPAAVQADLDNAVVISADQSTAKIGKRGQEILAELRKIAAIEKAARDQKDRKSELTAELFELTGGAKYATFMGVTAATRVDSSSQIVNTKLLLEVYPEAHAATVSQKPYSYYRQA